MRQEAIALRRISSSKQADGNSLKAQEASTERAAEELGLNLVKAWDEIQSSKKGKNFGRKDMEEMLRYCKKNRNVKYLLIDFMNRFMREVEVMIYYKVLFNQSGVQLYFCDAAQKHLNGQNQYAQLMLLIEGYKAEQDNVSRHETTVARMKARYAAGYYISHPHAGYMKSDIAGIHVPDLNKFNLLKKGGHLVIYKQHTASQAVQWMNDNGYRTLGGKRLDVDHYSEFIVDRYYCGKIDIKSDGWPKDVNGLHEPMFSRREHSLLVAAISKRNPKTRKQNNPEFPMANILRHNECKDGGGYEKFSGQFHNRGNRPNGRQRPVKPVYDCRDCRKRIPRSDVHNSLSKYLNDLRFLPNQKSFKQALVKVWRSQRGSAQQRLSVLGANKSRLEEKLRQTAASYNQEPEGATKNAIRLLLEDYDKQLKQLDEDISTSQNIEMESEDFVKFAFDFIASIRDEWWTLSPENRKRGEQVLFNGKIYADNSATIHTPDLSTIYRLGTNKNDPKEVNFNKMVELAEYCPPRPLVYLVSRLQA